MSIKFRVDNTGLDVDIHVNNADEGFYTKSMCCGGIEHPPFVSVTWGQWNHDITPPTSRMVTMYLDRVDVLELQEALAQRLGELDKAQKEYDEAQDT